MLGALNTNGGTGNPPMARPTWARGLGRQPKLGLRAVLAKIVLGIFTAGTLWGHCRDALGTHCSVPTALLLCLPRTEGQQGDKVQSPPPPHEPPHVPPPAPQAVRATCPTSSKACVAGDNPPSSPRSPLQVKQLFYFGV